MQAHAQAWLGHSPAGLQGALVAMGLLPPGATQMADELAWLGNLQARRRPYEAVTHCLCAAP